MDETPYDPVPTGTPSNHHRVSWEKQEIREILDCTPLPGWWRSGWRVEIATADDRHSILVVILRRNLARENIEWIKHFHSLPNLQNKSEIHKRERLSFFLWDFTLPWVCGTTLVDDWSNGCKDPWRRRRRCNRHSFAYHREAQMGERATR